MAHTDSNDSALRFSLLELDQDPVGTAHGAGPRVARQAAPGTVGKVHVASGEVDQDRAALARTERELANRITGLELSGKGGEGPGATFYDEGTVLLEGSAKKAIASRREWESRPLATHAAQKFREIVAAEERRDYQGVALNTARVDGAGLLTTDAGSPFRITEWSWQQLAGRAPEKAVRHNLNSWLAGCGDRMLLRTRNPAKDGTNRELFGALTPKYAVWDGVDAITALAEKLPAGARADLRYNQESTQVGFDASMHNPFALGGDEVAVGRMHRVGVRLRTSDNGTERYRIRAYVERIRCINCTLVQADWATIDRKHIGDPRAIVDAAVALFESAGEVLAEFDALWTEAAATAAFREVEGSESARDAFKALVNNKTIDMARTPGIKRKQLIDDLVSAWEYEPGTSWQAIQRAITRAAHASGYGVETMDALEEQAGELLYNRAWVETGKGSGLLV